MREITVKLYQFDELSERAKDRARDWWRDDGGMRSQDAWDQTKEDAENVGLKINMLSDHGSNMGEFMNTALETLDSVLENHGPMRETYKTAERYAKSLREAINKANEAEEYDILQVVETEFLHDLLEDYRIMYNQDMEYVYSDEAIDEAIRANEYEFTEDGKQA